MGKPGRKPTLPPTPAVLKQRERSRLIHQARRDSGACVAIVGCPNPRVEGQLRCAEHAKVNAIRAMASYEKAHPEKGSYSSKYKRVKHTKVDEDA